MLDLMIFHDDGPANFGVSSELHSLSPNQYLPHTAVAHEGDLVKNSCLERSNRDCDDELVDHEDAGHGK